tara:strand:+ start:138 stop:614 length:477 start_codon:yes stop_codon:yes gene_type:complete
MIKVVDHFLSEKESISILQYCCNVSYSYGEVDTRGFPPTGMVHDIKEDSEIYQLVKSKIIKSYREVRKLNLYRMYVNCFAPCENPYFHTDGDKGITFLYYANDRWELNDGGETQIVVNDEIKGILPIPNRIVGFDANLVHRATTFRFKHRFTLAAKFK